MQSSISPFKPHHRLRQVTGVFVGSLLALGLTGGGTLVAAATWTWGPWFGLAAGHESDLILDPDLERTPIPGGFFLDLTPGASLTRRVGRQGFLRLTGQVSVERFLDDAERTLFGGFLTADLVLRSRGPWEWRTSLGGTYFTDSLLASVQRLTAGLEASLGFVQPQWRLDANVGVQGRRYPDLPVFTTPQDLAVYTDGTANLGVSAALRPVDRWLLTLDLRRLGTEARDPAYNAKAWTLSGSLQWRVAVRTWLTGTGLYQTRQFTSRTPGVDEDSYWQIGLGLLHNLGRRTSMGLRCALADYTWTTGQSHQTTRVALNFTWHFGRPSAGEVMPPLTTTAAAEPSRPRADQPWKFRYQDLSASQIALIGDFNGWDAARHTMVRRPDGWWELALALPAGTYQYAYWIDGRLVTPPEAATTVDDGFGGRNGLLQVLPADP